MPGDVLKVIGLFLILVPTVICLFVRKKWILQYQRELLTCSLGTIFAIVFMDLIPELIEHATEKVKDMQEAEAKKYYYLFSLTIFAGLAFAFMMECVHEAMEGKCKDCDNDDNPSDKCKNQV